ncbi:F-box only protein 22-like [Apis laboriosa]|uniref:F-box only protein 22-like n=2 Tax=Apis TaxID=7459 RepID=UPI0003DF72B7|nr:F-box only protein 22-like isoform X1 [Apis dorsata]XP_043802298.1 F-box only protein 22-like [Apis laboriosa]
MENLPAKRSYEDDGTTSNSKERKKLNTSRYLTYDVLRIVFKYLNGMELSNASMVCRSWLEVANDEKRTRGGPICFIENLEMGVEYFNIQITEKLRIKPTLGLIFKAPRRLYNKQDCHCKILPKNCDAITLATFGILINDKEMESALDNIVCAFLPEIPDVTITIVAFSKYKVQHYRRMKKALSRHGTNGSKCLLLFCNQRGRALAQTAAGELQLCNKTVKPSVWGGVVKDLYVYNSKNPTNDDYVRFAFCVGITIVGSVDSWSIVMDESYKTKELVEQRLKLFKSHISLKKHSMGFMFACCERGENMFNERNVESSIFKKLFPDIPLVGCFGDGEFGETTIPTKSFNDKKNFWYHERSTVFLIITYG